MKRMFPWSACALLFLIATGPAALAATEKAMCVVCQVKSGETEAEAVRAERTFEGVRYALCSKACGEEFDADPAAYAKPTLPRPAPGFALRSLSGAPISNESLKGKVTLLDFWATWCVPCRKSMPELQALHAKYAERGFSVVGVSIDEDGAGKVKKFVAAQKIGYPIAIDGGETPAWTAFKVKAVPAAYLIDRDGRVVAQWLGAAANSRELEAALQKMLATP